MLNLFHIQEDRWMDKRKEANLRVKEKIATALLHLLEQKSISQITITELIQNARMGFEFFGRYGQIVLDLHRFGYGSIILDMLNQFHEEVAGTMPHTSIERYRLYIYIGSLYNTALMWLKNGKRESLEEITELFCFSLRMK